MGLLVNEEFREIEGFPEYLITNYGRLWSEKCGGKFLKIQDNGNGYKIVCLCNKSKPKTLYIHRLVCAAFNGSSTLEVNHKDGIKSNNSSPNLEWVSSSENKRHCYDVLRQPGRNIGKFNGENNPNSKKINIFLVQSLLRLGNIRGENIATFMNSSPATINRIKRGVHWQQRPA